MSDEFLIANVETPNIEFIANNKNDVTITYEIYSLSKGHSYLEDDHTLWIVSYIDDSIETIRYLIEGINNYEIRKIDGSITNVKVYTSKENIERIKQNIKNYQEKGNE